jgi:hypothetical protein
VETVRKFLSVIARVIAAIFAFLFVITTLLAILLTTLNGQMFNSRLYKNAMVELNIYGRLPEIVGTAITTSFMIGPCDQNQLTCSIDGTSSELQICLKTALGTAAYQAIGSGSRSPTSAELHLAQPCLEEYGPGQAANLQSRDSGSGMPLFMQNLTAADWHAFLSIVLPPDNLKSMTESILDQMFAYLNGEVDSVYVPLDTLKQRLLGQSGADLFLQLLNSQPPCNDQDLSQLLLGTSSGGMVFCKPPEEVLPVVTALLPDLLNSVVPHIPDKAFIIKPPAPGTPIPGSGPFGADPISTLRTIRLVMRLSLLIPLVLLLLVTLFAVRNLKSWMRWWGIPFFVAGTITLLFGISIVPAFKSTWTWFIAPRIPAFIPAAIPSIGLELLRSIIHSLSGWIIVPGIILCALGLGAWIGSHYIKGKINPELPEEPPTPMS